MELCKGGELFDEITQNAQKGLSEVRKDNLQPNKQWTIINGNLWHQQQNKPAAARETLHKLHLSISVMLAEL